MSRCLTEMVPRYLLYMEGIPWPTIFSMYRLENPKISLYKSLLLTAGALSKLITAQWSNVLIQVRRKRKALFLYKRWLEWMKPHSWFSCWSLSSMQAKLHCRWSEIKMLLMGIYKSFLISLIQNIKKAGSGLVVVIVFHATRVFCDTFLVSYVATYT